MFGKIRIFVPSPPQTHIALLPYLKKLYTAQNVYKLKMHSFVVVILLHLNKSIFHIYLLPLIQNEAARRRLHSKSMTADQLIYYLLPMCVITKVVFTPRVSTGKWKSISNPNPPESAQEHIQMCEKHYLRTDITCDDCDEFICKQCAKRPHGSRLEHHMYSCKHKEKRFENVSKENEGK